MFAANYNCRASSAPKSIQQTSLIQDEYIGWLKKVYNFHRSDKLFKENKNISELFYRKLQNTSPMITLI